VAVKRRNAPSPCLIEPALEHELVTLARAGDDEARLKLIEAFTPVIGRMARQYTRSSAVSREELMQEGVVGILRALLRFEATRGTPFWGYACWWVRQAMQQLVSELTRPIVLSDRALRQLARVKDARRTYAQTHGREPSISDLAAESGLGPAQVVKLIAVERLPSTLDEPMSHDGNAGSPLRERLADPDGERDLERVPETLSKEQLAALFAKLSARERSIVRSRFGFDGSESSLRELGIQFGLSAERVRQIEGMALDKLRVAAGA
jgi:RNA polymerase sigma factor (sigma-70 family)